MLTAELDYLCVCKTCRRTIAWASPEHTTAAQLDKFLTTNAGTEVLRLTTEDAKREADRREWFCHCAPATSQGKLF